MARFPKSFTGDFVNQKESRRVSKGDQKLKLPLTPSSASAFYDCGVPKKLPFVQIYIPVVSREIWNN